MSRARKPARLWLRPASNDRAAAWVILDGGKQFSTGCSEHDRSGAEKALAVHIGKQFMAAPARKNRDASEVTIAEVLAHYLSLKKDSATRPRELAARAENLMSYWGEKTLDDITSATCAEYVKKRGTPNGARRELEDLRAACRQAIADNVTRQAVTVSLPQKAKGRVKHLERSMLAKLIWAAYRKRSRYRGVPNKWRPTIHIARFTLAAVYTGSRSSRIWQASFVKEQGRPFIDLEAGVFYRAWEGEIVAANKRAPPIRLPDRLLAHMRRWHRLGAKYVVEYNGKPADPKRAFRNLVDDVLGADAEGVVRHTLRHTAATWLMQARTDKWEASGYLGMTLETLEKTYGHHHPDHQAGVGAAFTSGRAGRTK
ncbi:integrase [Rhizobium leguminosarum]|uniref:integrase n=1 Tax=Rhizobium leguminosarum TaxID=384 RepID=UPI0024A9E302|nr:integrase [Rhizobium leguminosarum]MDI5929589.1 integrase [Rhizobium leguminosarum]